MDKRRDLVSRSPTGPHMAAWLAILAVAAFAWWFFTTQIVLGRPVGTNPASDAKYLQHISIKKN
jgi:hypothetical protein